MPDCTGQQMLFGRVGRREIEADFTGGALSSDGRLMLVRQVDRQIGLSRAVAAALSAPRAPERITHPLHDLVAQRLYGLCCGYEDLNDHDVLRHDPLMQTAVGKVDELTSSPTFSRLETRTTRADVMALNRVLVEQFIVAQANATTATIRVRLLKIGAAIVRNTRRVRIMLASHHPLRDTFLTAAQALAPYPFQSATPTR